MTKKPLPALPPVSAGARLTILRQHLGGQAGGTPADIKQFDKIRRGTYKPKLAIGKPAPTALKAMRLFADSIAFTDLSFNANFANFHGLRVPENTHRRGLILATVFPFFFYFGFTVPLLDSFGFPLNEQDFLRVDGISRPFIDQGVNAITNSVYIICNFLTPVTILEANDR